MSLDKIVKIVEEEVEKEISQILSNAKEEKERILHESKNKIDEEIKTQKQTIEEEMNRKLQLEKLFIEAEANKKINQTLSNTFKEIYSEVIKDVKNRIINFRDQKELITNLILKSIPSISNSKGKLKVILSQKDYNDFSEEIKKELKTKNIDIEIEAGDIEGGVMIKQGNITIDASIEKIIKMFDPIIVNNIYKVLPKAKI